MVPSTTDPRTAFARETVDRTRGATHVDPSSELLRIAEDLWVLSTRLDAASREPKGGLETMALDQASQAVHLALVGVRDCLGTLRLEVSEHARPGALVPPACDR